MSLPSRSLLQPLKVGEKSLQFKEKLTSLVVLEPQRPKDRSQGTAGGSENEDNAKEQKNSRYWRVKWQGEKPQGTAETEKKYGHYCFCGKDKNHCLHCLLHRVVPTGGTFAFIPNGGLSLVNREKCSQISIPIWAERSASQVSPRLFLKVTRHL